MGLFWIFFGSLELNSVSHGMPSWVDGWGFQYMVVSRI